MKINLSADQTVTFKFLEHYDRNTLLKDLSGVSRLYPSFEDWLTTRFLSELQMGSRKLLIAHNGDTAIGYSLLKKTDAESKICTFYIANEFRGLGVGQELMSKSLQELDSGETFITVSDERLEELSPLLKAKGFILSSTISNMYRDGSDEHIWTL